MINKGASDMKQIIDGLTYNTATATKLGDHNAYGPNDFRWISESLYVTNNGSFFRAGEGGAMTAYAESYDGMTSGGDGIIPLTSEEALDWCERHAVAYDTIVDHFAVSEA